MAKNIQITTLGIGLLTFVIGFNINRMGGFEIISVLQICFFMLSTLDYVPRILSSYK